MARVTISIQGASKFKSRVKAIVPQVEKDLRNEIFDIANELAADAKKEIEAPKSGVFYRRKRPNGSWISWRASAPGQAPAKKTGTMLNRINVKKVNRAGKPSSRIIYPKIYKWIEKGLQSRVIKSRILPAIAPRPLFGPLLERYRPKFRDRIEAVVTRSMDVVIRRK